MTVNPRDDPPPAAPLFGDQEAVAASGVPLPSLRVLQAAGAIRAERLPKHHGGFRRMWPQTEVLKAAIAAALGEHLAWNIRLVAAVMSKVQAPLWNTLIDLTVSEQEANPQNARRAFITASPADWYGELIDRRFLFLRVPEIITLTLPEGAWQRTDLLLGMLENDTFIGISWELATPRGRRVARQSVGEEKAQQLARLYKLALASHDNFLSKATINLSLQVRAAWRRLHGLKSHFVQEAVQLRGGKA
jgi:hypothetical protein